MTDREALYKGTSYAAWGYLFLYLDINLGNVSILPRFVGYFLFFLAMERLSAQRRDLTLLRPLCTLLIVWNIAAWFASWLGLTLDGRFPALDLIVGAASLYFHFQFLTDCAALAARHQWSGDTLDRRLLRLRTVQTLLITAVTLLCYPAVYFGGVWEYAAILLAVAGVLVALFLMAALFSLRKLFREHSETLE